MAISKVQGAFSREELDGSVTCPFTDTPTEGNLMVAFCAGNTDIANASISGWTLATSAVYAGAGCLGVWYKVAGAAESKDVTITWTGSTVTSIVIMEWTGLTATPLDKIASANYDTAVHTKSSGTTATTTVADELCIAGFRMGNSTSAASWSNSFVLEKAQASGFYYVGSLVATSAWGAETTLSWTTDRYCGGLIATFKGATVSTWIPKVIMVM